MTSLPLWVVESEGVAIRIFGGGPPLAEAWSSPELEALVAASDAFWNEIPAMGSEVQRLAIKYGVVPDAPLATWLTADDLGRVERAAKEIGADFGLLGHVRPWLAAQMLNTAAQNLAGLHREYSAEHVLTETAERAAVPVHSEYTTPLAVFESFSAWPRAVEVDRLLSTLAEIESGTDAIRRDSDAWRAGDPRQAEVMSGNLHRYYPALYEHLVVGRNRVWVDRIQAMVARREASFIVVGGGHLAGPDSLPYLLECAGIGIRLSEAAS